MKDNSTGSNLNRYEDEDFNLENERSGKTERLPPLHLGKSSFSNHVYSEKANSHEPTKVGQSENNRL